MPLRPVEHALLKGAMFGFDTYEVYAADSEPEALDFLNRVKVIEGQYYVVVETPAAIVARDRGGIYRPSKSWRGDGWVSQKWRPMDAKGRRQFWRHWTGSFGEGTPESSTRGKKWYEFWK
jgi:hypothetical protein